MNLESTLPVFAIVCNLAFYGASGERAFEQRYSRVVTEQACYDLGRRLKADRAWPLYRLGEALENIEGIMR